MVAVVFVLLLVVVVFVLVLSLLFVLGAMIEIPDHQKEKKMDSLQIFAIPV